MEVVAFDVDCVEVGVGDFDAGGIDFGVELTAHLQAVFGRGRGDQLDDRLMRDEGLPRQFIVMNEKRRCSILFHLLVPGGR